MSNNKVVKSVSFSLLNEKDKQILKAVKRRKNFSQYVKSLIYNDLDEKDTVQPDESSTASSSDKLSDIKAKLSQRKNS